MRIHPIRSSTPVTIYLLRDPLSGQPAYVGRTTSSLHGRLIGHLNERDATPKCRWIAKLQTGGRSPLIEALEVTDIAHGAQREYAHIMRLRDEGYKLLNVIATEPAQPTQHAEGVTTTVDVSATHLGIREAAALLGVHPNTIRYRIKTKVYAARKVLTPYGDTYLIHKDDFFRVHPSLQDEEASGVSDSMGDVAMEPLESNGLVGRSKELVPALSRQEQVQAMRVALQPLVDELARARADAAAAHERAGRLQAERDAAILERNVERTRRYEREQRRPWWARWWSGLWGGT